MQRKRVIVLLATLGAALGLTLAIYALDRRRSAGEARRAQAHLVRGKNLLRQSPPEGSRERARWIRGLNREDRLAWALAGGEPARSPEPTPAQIAALRVRALQREAGPFGGNVFENWRPLLEMGRSADAHSLRLNTVRGPGGLETTVWAADTFAGAKVLWANGETSPVTISDTLTGSPPLAARTRDFTGLRTFDEANLWAMRNQEGVSIPWERRSRVHPLASTATDRYRFGLEQSNAGKPFTAIVVADLEEKTVVDIVPLPGPAQQAYRVFNPETGYLLVVDSAGTWLVMLDIKRGAETNAAEMDDIMEAVIRHEIDEYLSSLRAYPNHRPRCHFLSLRGKKDPSDAFVKRFANCGAAVKKFSQCHVTEDRGLVEDNLTHEGGFIFTIESIKRVSPTEAEVESNAYGAPLAGSGYRDRVVRKGGKWVVAERKMLWIS